MKIWIFEDMRGYSYIWINESQFRDDIKKGCLKTYTDLMSETEKIANTITRFTLDAQKIIDEVSVK